MVATVTTTARSGQRHTSAVDGLDEGDDDCMLERSTVSK